MNELVSERVQAILNEILADDHDMDRLVRELCAASPALVMHLGSVLEAEAGVLRDQGKADFVDELVQRLGEASLVQPKRRSKHNPEVVVVTITETVGKTQARVRTSVPARPRHFGRTLPEQAADLYRVMRAAIDDEAAR